MHAPICLTTTSILLLASSATAQFSIDPAVNYGPGPQPSGITAGDFDGDGDMDLATTVEGPDRVATLINDGSGVYSAGPSAFLGSSSSPQDLVAGDLDGDGDTDLAVAVRDPSGAVLIMVNSGAGTFTAGGSFAVGDRPRGLSIGDIDGDGDLDLACANRDDGTASVLTNNGSGSFSVQTTAAGGETRDTALGDLDGDGDMDLAVADSDNREVDLYTNNAGSFTPSSSLYYGPFVRPDGVEIADLDNDGNRDVVAAVSDQTLGINQAAVFMNGTASFTGPFGYDTGGTNTSGIRVADFDCDGLLDIVTSNQDSNNVSLLRNTGGAVFGAAQVMAAGTTPDELATADLDGDGDADFATANKDSNNLSVFINQTCTPAGTPGDVNGDGLANFADILQIIGAWGPCTGCPEDLSGNGQVDFADILLVIGNWTP
ncbi:MAG: FG-GAP-like repeat-containing protein [Planctomycetota bacterium]|jgi:hypothetical protein